MKTKIKHFIVDLEEISELSAYDSDIYILIKKIKESLEELLLKLNS